VCAGHGEISRRSEENGRYRMTFADCFLCKRVCAITAKTLAAWINQGKPMSKEDFQDV
jgi:hypothetical protein